ncbi:S49 family peptidase [Methylopila capsulata]|nr:S49 family peptidase [Methylopila capsulata]
MSRRMSLSTSARLRAALRPVLPERWRTPSTVVPVVRIQGAIGIGTPFRPAVTLSSVAGPLEKAFAVEGAKEVAVIVNSPGGSPVQAHLICRRIRQLAEETGLPVTIVVEDVAASGGYMIACAGDEIVADPSSIVGSIGVVSAGFGFDRAIERLGIDRRLYTSGENKAILDPFQPEKAEDVERLKEIQREVHEHFIALVKERRGASLSDDAELFTGAFWTASSGLALGLVDRIGDLRSVMRERWGDKVELRLMTKRTPLLKRLMGRGAEGVEASLPDEAMAAIEARALWSRFGL